MNDLSPGNTFPDLELPDHNDVPRTLSELAEGDPVVLNFFRGWWCPKEQTFFRLLAALQDEVEVAYSRLVSVSIDDPVTQSAFRAGLDARWTFLSDHERRYVDALDLRETTDTLYRPYVTTTFTLRPDLTSHTVYNRAWLWARQTLEALSPDPRATSPTRRPTVLPTPPPPLAAVAHPARASSVNSHPTPCSAPPRPSLTGTPTTTSFNPYSPSQSTAQGNTRFWSFMIASTISTAEADGA